MSRRRDLFQLPLGALPFLAAAAPQLPTATLDPGQARLTREPFGELRIYFEGSTGQLASMTAGSLRLKPGASPHPPHEHPEEEFLVVAEGEGEIEIGGVRKKAGPGAIMYCAAHRPHGIVNTGKTPLLFYFFKWKA